MIKGYFRSNKLNSCSFEYNNEWITIPIISNRLQIIDKYTNITYNNNDLHVVKVMERYRNMRIVNDYDEKLIETVLSITDDKIWFVQLKDYELYNERTTK